MRRDVGGHPNGDAGRAVDQQVGNARREHDRLGLGAVVVGLEGNRRLIDLREHLIGDPRQAAFGVPHRRRAVPVERTEIARAVDQRIPQRERLGHAHKGLVERGIAVRMEAPHDIADDFRALAMLGVGSQILLPHRVEDPALHRLESVPDVRQRSRRDDRERVVEIPALRRVVQRHHVAEPARRRGHARRRFRGFRKIEQRGIGCARFGHRLVGTIQSHKDTESQRKPECSVSLRLCGLLERSLTLDPYVPVQIANILPGFIRLSGSRVRLMAFMTSSASPCSSAR